MVLLEAVADVPPQAIVAVPTWALAIAVPVFVTIAGALAVLAFRSGGLVEGIRNIGATLGAHDRRLRGVERVAGEHGERIAALEARSGSAIPHRHVIDDSSGPVG